MTRPRRAAWKDCGAVRLTTSTVIAAAVTSSYQGPLAGSGNTPHSAGSIRLRPAWPI
jgi:hypothetical protein